MDLFSKKVLVTGADGFIGSHLVESLVKSGCKVKAFTYYNALGKNGWLDDLDKEMLKSMEVVSGDIRDYNFVQKSLKNIDIVFHLAALIGIPYSYVASESYFDTNVKGTMNILNAAKEIGTDKIIITSTSETYGTARYVPIDEKHLPRAQSPYAASKVAADQMAISYYTSFNLPVAIIRPFNTYGPRQSARAVIPTIISQIANKVKRIRIGNIKTTRDFSYVDDTVNGFIKMAESENCIGEEINIGSGKEISIKELIDLIRELMNSDVEILVEDERIRPEKSEVNRLCADITKARTVIGYMPKYLLREGLKETINWFLREENLENYTDDRYYI